LYEISDINDVVNNYNFDFIQLPFNLLDNEKEKIKILKTAKEKQIEIHVRSIFLQGLFFKPFPNFDKKLNPLKKYIAQIKEISVKSNTDIESLALKYPLEKDYIDKVIFGVHNIEQFSKNINTVNSKIKLPIDDIENINVKEKELLKPYNWI
jgi:aryl-alcohol dehydrogenase-like predicted oxidoreductase